MRVLLLLALLLGGALAGAILLPSEPTRAVGPTVIATWWEPKYPQEGDEFEVMTRITPEAGTNLTSVGVTYCTVPVGVCTFNRMALKAGDVWNRSLDLYDGAVGAKVLIYAYDSASNLANGVNSTIHYAKS